MQKNIWVEVVRRTPVGYHTIMHKLFKGLTIVCFVLGSVMYFSGNTAFFSKSGGTGLVLLAIGTPVFAVLTSIFRDTNGTDGNLAPAASQQRPRKLFWFGLIMTLAGLAIYFLAFVGDQGLGGIAVAGLGALALLIGVVSLFINVLRR